MQDTFAIWNLLLKSVRSHYQFTPWGPYVSNWNLRDAQQFVADHIEMEERRDSFVFLIGKEIVGMGSVAPLANPIDVQISLWVGEPFQGKGIGPRIVATIEWYVFEVWGFPRLIYYHEAANLASFQLPQKCKFERANPFIKFDGNYLNNELVPWCIWVKWRNPNLQIGRAHV